MKIEELDKLNGIEVGDIVKFVSKGGINFCFVTEDVEDNKIRLANIETGELYFRKFTSVVHVKNHLTKHYGHYRLLKSDRIKLIVE